jgi:uncharacterized protein DUF1735
MKYEVFTDSFEKSKFNVSKKYSILFPGLVLAIGLMIVAGSCVKTNPYYTNFSDIQPIAEFFLPGPSILRGPLVSAAYIATQSTPTDYTIDVNLASPKPAPKDLVVTVAVDTVDFNRFNDSVSQGNPSLTYTLLPANTYTVPNWKVTIPAGQNKASLHIQVNSALITNSSLAGPVSYLLPLKITDASGTTISGNFSVGYWIILPSNPWVGLYHAVGYKKDVGVITNINQDKYLYFADPNLPLSLAPVPYVGTNTVIGQAGDDVTYIDYALAMDLTVDPVTNLVTVTTDQNQGGHKENLTNNGPCVYDPVKRTFTLNYVYTNAYGNIDTLYEQLTWKPLPQ